MKASLYFVETSKPIDVTLAELKREWTSKRPGRAALVTRFEFGFLPRLIDYSLLLTFKAFQLGNARARTMDLEWLRLLAATRSIERAVDFTRPSGRHVLLAASEEVPGGVLAKLGQVYAPPEKERQAALDWLAGQYGFSKAALAHYSCEDLAIERTVLSLLE